MILVLKKITCFIVVLTLLFSFVVFAEQEFLVYGKDNNKLSQVLGFDEQELNKYCQDNHITYFAVNSDNTKQIKRTEVTDEFARKVVDLSAWEDSKILQLSSSLSGIEGASGEIVVKNSYKFLKVEAQTKDSGGDYVLTQYTTVKNQKRIALTFFTKATLERDYVEEIFNAQFEEETNYKPFVIIGVVLFGLVGLVVLAFVVKDFYKAKE